MDSISGYGSSAFYTGAHGIQSSLQKNSQENSNVDPVEQRVNDITTQNAVDANAKSIQTNAQAEQSLFNIMA